MQPIHFDPPSEPPAHRRAPSCRGMTVHLEPCGWCADPRQMEPGDYDEAGVCRHCGGSGMVEIEDGRDWDE